jgi:glucosamine--fructose-6-phosphate aminotransferase (isomerizing)
MTSSGSVPGDRIRREIGEQPGRWNDLLTQEAATLRRLRALIRSRPPRLVLFVARGTSDNAALYGSYLVQVALGVPAASASPSAITLYGAKLDLNDALVVAVSQSGQSPDLLAVLDDARRSRAVTVAVTNRPDSELGRMASEVVDVRAGAETAVAATKSYTAQLLALAGLFTDDAGFAKLRSLPELGEQVLAESGDPVTALAGRYRFATRLVAAGRGYSSATAREAALKLMETTYISALGISTADLLHGPIAVLDHSVPLLCFASAGPDATEAEELVALARRRGVDAEVVGDGAVPGNSLPALLPRKIAPEIRPILEILPAQLLAAEMAVARGLDPDAPRGLSKVTKT